MSTRVAVVLALFFGLVVGCGGGFVLGMLATKGGASAIAGMFATEQKADVGTTKSVSRDKFRFDYPGNWSIDTADEDYDPDSLFSVDSPGNCYVQFIVYDSAVDADEMVENQVEAFVPKLIKDPKRTRFVEWGAHEGSGVTLEGKILGVTPGSIRVFGAKSDEKDVAFTAVEMCFDDDMAQVRPGFELVRRTFELK